MRLKIRHFPEKNTFLYPKKRNQTTPYHFGGLKNAIRPRRTASVA